jgi:hypothetical protein
MIEELVQCGVLNAVGTMRKDVGESSNSKRAWCNDSKRQNSGRRLWLLTPRMGVMLGQILCVECE